jgi:hypothetical protein
MVKHFAFIIRISLLVLLAGCSYTRKNSNYSSTASVTPNFSSINSTVIQPKCMPCHQPGGGTHDFSSYSGVMLQVNPGSPDGSTFYKVLEAGSMPVDRPMLSDDEILAVYQWIQNGAQND